ncbi:membrane receptor RagA, partial [Acinetobacter baumannii]
MNKGKSTCKVLKDIRQKIADANGIRYVPKECNFKGECKGTCPACEAEIRYLENELKRKQRNGFAVKIGGIA